MSSGEAVSDETVPESMLRLVLQGSSRVRVETGPMPTVGDGEVLVRVVACGICGSDLHALRIPASEITTTWTLGHEVSGVIEALGPHVLGWAIGDRVVVEPTIPDDASPLSRIGRYELSDLRHIGGPDWPGGMADFMRVPSSTLHAVPDAIDLHLAAMAEVYAVAIHAVGLFPVAPGEPVLVIGSGPVGASVAEVARLSGADPVVVLGKPSQQLSRIAASLDVRTVDADGRDPGQAVMQAIGGDGPSLTFEAVGGAGETLDTAFALTRPAGRVCILGGFTGPVPIDAERARRKELTVGWSFCYGRRGYRKELAIALDLMRTGRLRPEYWVTHRMPLSHAEEAFRVASDRTTGSIKVLLEP